MALGMDAIAPGEQHKGGFTRPVQRPGRTGYACGAAFCLLLLEATSGVAGTWYVAYANAVDWRRGAKIGRRNRIPLPQMVAMRQAFRRAARDSARNAPGVLAERLVHPRGKTLAFVATIYPTPREPLDGLEPWLRRHWLLNASGDVVAMEWALPSAIPSSTSRRGVHRSRARLPPRESDLFG